MAIGEALQQVLPVGANVARLSQSLLVLHVLEGLLHGLQHSPQPEMSPISALMDNCTSLALSLNCLSPISTLIETEVKAKTSVEMLKESMAVFLS